MSPASGYVDGYPYGSSQFPCMQQPWPGSVPTELRVDPSRYPVMQVWPCIGGHHNRPAPCHFCHNYMAFPSYYSYPPPCPLMFQPQPLHFYGAYPGNPQAFPVQQVPPPGYWVEQPRYEHDKITARDHHCCDCPNHVCKPNEEKGIKIEEQEPNVKITEKDSSGENNSLVPVHMKNYPHPILWVSPELMKNFEGGKLPKQRIMDSKDDSHEVALGAKSVKKEPTQNGWFPLKGDKFTPPLPVSEQKRSENQQDGGKKQQFPSPIIWMPSSHKQEEEVNDNTGKSLRPSEKAPSTFKIFPVHSSDGRDDDSREVANNKKKNSARAQSDKVGEPVKQIIVKDVKSCTNKNLEDGQGTDFSDKRVKDQMSTPSSKEKPASPKKASKSPPVCLRVDPLPRRKSRGSGSPSPPDTKRGSSRDASSKSKDIKVQDLSLHNENASKDMKENEGGVKRVEVMGETRSNTNDVESMRHWNLEHSEAAKKEDKIRSQDGGSANIEHTKAEVVGAQGNKMEKFSTKKSLSDVEAARLIQSAYRGYEVRKCEYLKKLKQMARVRGEVVNIRKSVDALKSGTEDLTDQKSLVIGESIMRLLLQLDSIQGLHPSLRDIRKSLARELVYLQSELDSTVTKMSDESVKELSTASAEESRSQDVSDQQDEQARETDGHFVQALPDENGDSRRIELGETQHHQHDSVRNESLTSSKVDDAMVDECAEIHNSDSGQGEEKGECEASATCSKETLGNEHAEELHSEVGGVTSSEMEFMPTNQTDSELPMLLVEKKDEVNSGGTENGRINNCVHGEEDGSDLESTDGESNMDLLAELPTEIAAKEIHERYEGKHEQGDAGSHQVLESSDGSPKTIEQNMVTEWHVLDASKGMTSDGNLCLQVQLQQPEVPETDLEGCKNVDAVPVHSAHRIAKTETAIEGNVNFDETDRLNDASPIEEVVQPAPGLEKETSSSISGEPVKDSGEDPNKRCEEQELVDVEATREPEIPEEKVALVAHDQSVHGKTSEFSSQDTRADSCEQHNDADANKKLIGENQKLREMMEKLLEAGKDQLNFISDLTGRVKDLENKLARRRKTRARRCKAATMRSRHARLSPDSRKKVAGDVVM